MSSINTSVIDTILLTIAQAHANKDAALLASLYRPSTRLFDLAPPLSRTGMNIGDIAAWFDTWEGPINLEHQDVNTEISGNLAITTALLHMSGKKKEGEEIDLWFRATTCLKQYNGRWLIIHEHTSVPFYMDGSERAALDLQPEQSST